MKKATGVMVYLVLGICMITCFGCAGRKKSSRDALLAAERDAALSFEDIALTDAPDMSRFKEPSPTLKSVFKDIYFQYDSSVILEDQRNILENIASWMKNHPQAAILVEGHCDERGSNEYNLALGEQRALSVRRYLVTLGVSSSRMHTVSYGEEKPAVSGHDEEAWKFNRRAHFLLAE
ncbi:MAG: peptidoglycan-associated lipoprotein Pal [Candidatus Aureabacteria bacterium]|nr:peptidoglycan-associated lipoprotein Pal [Candidatus Auribacterota bacterium]